MRLSRLEMKGLGPALKQPYGCFRLYFQMFKDEARGNLGNCGEPQDARDLDAQVDSQDLCLC